MRESVSPIIVYSSPGFMDTRLYQWWACRTLTQWWSIPLHARFTFHASQEPQGHDEWYRVRCLSTFDNTLIVVIPGEKKSRIIKVHSALYQFVYNAFGDVSLWVELEESW